MRNRGLGFSGIASEEDLNAHGRGLLRVPSTITRNMTYGQKVTKPYDSPWSFAIYCHCHMLRGSGGAIKFTALSVRTAVEFIWPSFAVSNSINNSPLVLSIRREIPRKGGRQSYRICSHLWHHCYYALPTHDERYMCVEHCETDTTQNYSRHAGCG